MERSRLSITTQMGFFSEEVLPAEVIAEVTEPGEVRIEIGSTADWTNERPVAAAYLAPTDAAVLGLQLIEASRAATPPPPGDED
jgi:hypothetical protein